MKEFRIVSGGTCGGVITPIMDAVESLGRGEEARLLVRKALAGQAESFINSLASGGSVEVLGKSEEGDFVAFLIRRR